MNKILKLLTVPVMTLSVLGIVSCGNNSTPSPTTPNPTTPTPTPTVNPTTPAPTTPSGGDDYDLIFYFYRFDENYNDIASWMWADGGTGVGLQFKNGTKVQFTETGEWNWYAFGVTFGQTYDVFDNWDFTSATTITMSAEYWQNILIRDTAGNKDFGDDRKIDITQVDQDGVIRVYSITQNPTFFYDINDVPTSPISDVFFRSTTQINVSLYYALDGAKKDDFMVSDGDGKNYAIRSIVNTSSAVAVHLESAHTDYTKPLYLTYLEDTYSVSYRGVYNTRGFNDIYSYDGKDLGAVVSVDSSATTFKVWSPSATSIKVNFYESATSTGIKESFDLTLGEKGVWSYTAGRDLHGTYYTYTVEVLGKTNAEVADPYASSSNANGQRSLVVNWGKIETALTSDAPEVATPSSVSVMEMHVRDFTAHESWGGTEANKGKYLGMIEEGTKLENTGEPTGFDYVKSLGATHIQLQPVYDFNSVDETKLNDTSYQTARRNGIYNWGYDPYSYSSLEGSYSSDPNDGFARINEFRQLTNAYNAEGIGVIMDVVYNHMPSGANSTYEKIMPDYYFRTNSYSGAGTDLASENDMVKNMIIQTTEQLTKRYNLAGFRFDLMGLITKEAMMEVDTNLRTFDEDIVLYGEGWNMYNGDKYLGKEAQAIQGAFKNSDAAQESKIGFFNDTFRDGMKGNVFDEKDKGFLQGVYDGSITNLATLRNNVINGLFGTQVNITRWANHFSGVSVNYVEAHDNLTLHDKLYATNPEMSEEERSVLQMFATSTVALSTGVAFFQLGQEFARSKEMPASWLDGPNAVTDKYTKVGDGEDARYFVNDSYNFSDEINAIDWTLTKEKSYMVSAFKRDLALRNSSDLEAIRPAAFDDVAYATLSAADAGFSEDDYTKMIGYTVSISAATKLAIVLNFSSTDTTLANTNLASGATKYYVDGEVVNSLPETLKSLSYLVVAY